MKVYDKNICKSDFFDTAVADVLRAVDGRSLMGSFILAFCCIDYMGMATNPTKEKNKHTDFKAFVHDYMGLVEPKYKYLAEELWTIRNSVIHVYGESKATRDLGTSFSFSHQHPEYHLQIIADPNPKLWLNLPEFLAEVITAIELFFRQNATDEALLKLWYDMLLIVQGVGRKVIQDTGKPIHAGSHRFLRVLDAEPAKELQEVRESIRADLHALLNEAS